MLTVKHEVLTRQNLGIIQNESSIMRNQDFTCRSFFWLFGMCLCFSGLVFDLAGLRSSSTTTHWFTWYAVLQLQTRNLANHCHMYIWKLGESLFRCAASTRSPRRRRGAAPPRGRCNPSSRSLPHCAT